MVSAKRPTEDTNWLPWLAAILVVLVGFLVWDWYSESATSESKPTRAAAVPRTTLEDAPPVKPLASLDLDRLHDTVKRPLFEKSRRSVEPLPPVDVAPRPVPAAPVMQAPAADENALTLLGVVMGDGRAVALLKRNKGGASVRAELGDIVEGWTITQIEAQRVILSQGSRQIALYLFRKPTGNPPRSK
jgi:hypothetical protein